MKSAIITLLGAGALLFSLSAISHAAETTTEEVGFNTVIADAAGPSSPTFTFINLSMVGDLKWQGPIAGQIAGSTGPDVFTQLTFAANSFTAGAYDEGDFPTHYIQVNDGSSEGFTVDIVSNTTDTITVATTADLSALVTTDPATTLRVIEHITISDLLGSTQAEVEAERVDPSDQTMKAGIVTSGGSPSTADQFLFWDEGSQAYVRYFFNNNDLFGTAFVGWVPTTSPDIEANDLPVYNDRGMIVRRVAVDGSDPGTANDDLLIVVDGAVKQGITSFSISATNGEIVQVAYPYPVPTDPPLTLGNSNLFQMGVPPENTVLASGGSPSTADNILIWNGSGFDRYFYNNNDLFGTAHVGWVPTADPAINADDTPIPEGSFFIVRRASVPFVWNIPAIVN